VDIEGIECEGMNWNKLA